MSVGQMYVGQMSVSPMSVSPMSVSPMSVDQMSVSKMSVSKMSVSKMSVGQNHFRPKGKKPFLVLSLIMSLVCLRLKEGHVEHWFWEKIFFFSLKGKKKCLHKEKTSTVNIPFVRKTFFVLLMYLVVSHQQSFSLKNVTESISKSTTSLLALVDTTQYEPPEEGLLKKGSCLARALGVTKFISTKDIILIQLFRAS
jgi:hypothetical protein